MKSDIAYFGWSKSCLGLNCGYPILKADTFEDAAIFLFRLLKGSLGFQINHPQQNNCLDLRDSNSKMRHLLQPQILNLVTSFPFCGWVVLTGPGTQDLSPPSRARLLGKRSRARHLAQRGLHWRLGLRAPGNADGGPGGRWEPRGSTR